MPAAATPSMRHTASPDRCQIRVEFAAAALLRFALIIFPSRSMFSPLFFLMLA